MLNFKPITTDDRELLTKYLYRYGENSCQHSFAAMYCMSSKYGDMYCEKDGFLYIHRSKKSGNGERVYLAPFGDMSDEAGFGRAVEEIITDAHENGARVRFETLTKTSADAVLRLFPERFSAESVRDFAEYIYTYEKLADLPGKAMASKRYDISTFFRDFGDRVQIEAISTEHIEDIRAFQACWLSDMLRGEEDVQLECENEAIQLGLSHFEELSLSGIVVFIDGRLCGYAYGVPLSDNAYDVIIEKGDRSISDIYRVLNRDLVRMCCKSYSYINREEDVGVEGLRKAKMSYKPDILLEKFVVTEVPTFE